MTDADRAGLIACFSALPRQVEELVGGLTPAQLVARPADGGWSVAQIVHHLADSRMVSFIRIKLLLTTAGASWGTYDEAAWARLPDSDNAAIEDSLALLRALHARWLRLFAELGPDAWTRTGTHTVTGSVATLAELVTRYTAHGEAHLEQIKRAVAAFRNAAHPV